MKTFTFNNYQDFGIFLKINYSDMLNNIDVSLHGKLNTMFGIYENSKGGCGCNLAKRKEAAKNSYIEGVKVIYADNNLTQFTKAKLSNSDQLEFKQDDNQILLI